VTLQVRPLREAEWQEAMELTGRAFLHEPFVIGMLGADPLERYPSVLAMYRATPYSAHCLGAFADGCLVGAVGTEPAGSCHHCLAAQRGDLEGLYHRNAAAAHQRQHPEHGWLGRVAVEPALHGAGVGGALVSGALAHLASTGTPTALLDCEVHRVTYYEARGFAVLETFEGSFDNQLALMRAGTGAP